jgi:S1-C subfamily serine protease
MKRVRGFLRSSFGSAVIGGAVVGVFFLVAISAGWVDSGDDTVSVPAEAAPAAPISAGGEDGETNLVGEIYKRDGQGVAFIEADQPAGEASPFEPFGRPEGGGTATGSGFVIDEEGHLLTNSHVVEGATAISVTLGADDEAHPAEVVGTDPATDVALLKVDVPADQLHPLALGDSSELEVGDPVVAIGNPFGLDRTVTSGIVSALQRQIEAPNGFSISHVIQTDAAINPGNSGGPLIDAEGRVIGINSQIAAGSGGGNVGIGFAVPINTAREVAGQLERDGSVEHAYLGISGGTITPEIAEALNLPVDEGVLVAEAVRGGPADEAGIEGGDTEATIEGASVTLGGDIITELDGRRVPGMEELVNVVNGRRAGDEIEVTLLRGGDERTVTVTLGDRPDSVE